MTVGMERTRSSSNDRRFARHRQRFPCNIEAPDSTHRGFLADASAGGLFITTSVDLEIGTRTSITIEPLGSPEIVLNAMVVRVKKSHRSASSVVPPGIGFVIETAPEAYYQMLMKFDLDASGGSDPTPAP